MSISLEGEARKPSLLIIDDQPENIRLLVRILNQAGYLDITTATDPARVSELHALCRPDIVLLDLAELVRLCQRIARSHHERWDGSGYPDGLVEQGIALEARIVAVANFFDALTHERPYRGAQSEGETLDAITDGSGSHFDPVVVDALSRIDRRWVRSRSSTSRRRGRRRA